MLAVLLLIYITITMVRGGAVKISPHAGICTVYFSNSVDCSDPHAVVVYDLYGQLHAKITEIHTPSGQVIQKCVGRVPTSLLKGRGKAIKFTPTDNPCVGTPDFPDIVPCFGNYTISKGQVQANSITTKWTEVLSATGHVELTCIFGKK